MLNLWKVLILPFLVLSLSGWFWSEKKEIEPAVVGVWKSINLPQPVLLSFSSDGMFKTSLENSQVANIIGDFRVVADQVIFDNDQAAATPSCKERAYYYFKIVEGKLRLTLVADSCEPRRAILAGYWQLISSPAMEKMKNKKKKS